MDTASVAIHDLEAVETGSSGTRSFVNVGSAKLLPRKRGQPARPLHLANSPALSYALPIAYFDSLGLLACSMAMRNPLNRRTRTRIYGGVAGADG